MKILVCIKQVPSSNKVGVDPKTGVILRAGAESKLNPYDLYALETAFLLKEQNGGTVTVLTMGPDQASAVLREAYSMGADNGYILSDRRFAGADVLATSYTLSSGILKIQEENGSFDLIICGKQTTDGDTAQVGAEISERLSLPCVANVVSVGEYKQGRLFVKADTGDSIISMGIITPCLICVDKDICTPRLPSYKRMKATKEREVTKLTLDSFADKDEKHYGLAGSPTQVKRIFPPEKSSVREVFEGEPEALAETIAQKLAKERLI